MAQTLEKARPLTGYGLKYIALVSMLCDHVGAIVIRRGIYAPYIKDGLLDFAKAPHVVAAASIVYSVLDVLGHAAFPIFCFLIAEGYVKTRNRRRYLRNLLVFALLSEVPYDLAHYGVWFRCSLQNVLFTLSIGVATLLALDAVARRFAGRRAALWVLSLLAAVLGGGLAYLVRSEYVFLGVFSIVLFYLLRGRGFLRMLGLVPLLPVSPWILLALPVLLLYGGGRGKRGNKWFFYIFYPAHFLVLAGIAKIFATFPV